MTEFEHLNVTEYNDFSQTDTSFTVNQTTCVCCFKQNTAFVKLSKCKHTSFFEFVLKYKVEYQYLVVCIFCHQFLKKIDYFKQLVEANFHALNKQGHAVSQPQKCYQDLIISKINILELQNDNTVKNERFEIIQHTNTSQVHYDDIVTHVKIEHESNSDFEIDVPLSEIKKKIKKKKKKKNKSKEVVNAQPKKKSSVNEKYEGKIAIVNLSKEEMMEERERDLKKESYLKLRYKCANCITGFDHEITLKDHLEKRHGDKKNGFVCDICKSVLSTETSYKEHTKRHTRRYECVECGKRNNNVYSVIKHYNEYHGVIQTQFTCADCGFTTQSHRSYRYHRDKHKEKQACSLCDSTFVNKAGLRVHMLWVHRAGRGHACGRCGARYRSAGGLAAHARRHAPRPAYCATCHTHYASAHNLQHHLRTHSNHITDTHKKFICDECGNKFLTKSSLREHIDFIHLKTNKHKCDKCEKVFINGSALKKHDNFVHKKMRPPRNKICDHCGRGFTTLTILQAHVRTHTGERPLRCPHCPASFGHAAALYTHQKLLHTNK